MGLFFGGTHPDPKKELCPVLPVEAPAPETVIIPLRQHIGAPCAPLVRAGDYVLKGQKIGDGEGLCVPVHASVSGTVKAVEERPASAGGTILSVVIQNDFREEKAEAMPPLPEGASAEELIARIREAGIAGMGGATFPTDAKLKSAGDKAETVLVNACECEPYITADDVLLQTKTDRFLEGLKSVQRALSPKKCIVAIEDNKKEAARLLKEKAGNVEGVEVKVLPTRYPQGAEKQLIQAVTGKEVPSGGLPADVGCVVMNAATVTAVGDAVVEGLPLTERIVTVTGEAVKHPGNYLARIGTPFENLIQASGGLKEDVWKVLSGGPMMGIAQETLQAPVTKGTNAILCLSNAQNGEVENPICIRCAKCLDACPIRLEPLHFYLFMEGKDAEALRELHILDCIECGCCAYVCPGKLPLVEKIREGKQLVKEVQA